MTSFAARIEAVPWPLWIAFAAAAFFCWPLALAALVCLLLSGAMRCCGTGFGRPHETAFPARPTWSPEPRASGNRAFDEYRAATLRRLEEEHQDFQGFLGRLRAAKDKAEFDQFMTGRARGPQSQG